MTPNEEIHDICMGDRDAIDFLTAFRHWVNAIDDGVDRDGPVDRHTQVLAHLKWTFTVATNPFFLKHQAVLLPLIHVVAVSYIDSVAWEASDNPITKIAGRVLSSQYQEVDYMVAYLVGGIDHQIRMSEAHRAFHMNSDKPGELGLVIKNAGAS